MKLEVGKKYRTRDGREVRIVKTTSPGPHSCEGRFIDGYTEWWAPTGVFNTFVLGQDTHSDLIEEIKEHNVSNKVEKLNKLVDDMPVCNDGKAKIRALVEEITGEKLTKPAVKPTAGQIWRRYEYIYQLTGMPGGWVLANLRGGNTLNGLEHDKENAVSGCEFVASSLKDYVANGGKL